MSKNAIRREECLFGKDSTIALSSKGELAQALYFTGNRAKSEKQIKALKERVEETKRIEDLLILEKV